MREYTELPLSIRDVAPCEGAVRLTGNRPDGLPDGVHTGGAWLFEGMVYKPLDGRPYANATCHLSTLEDKCLEAFSGQPFFPANWRVEEHNGRRFVVRAFARILEPAELDESTLLALKAQVEAVNAAEWEIGDFISLGELEGQLFIVDLSTAHPQRGVCAYAADDSMYLSRLFEKAGHKALWDRLYREKMNAFYREIGWDNLVEEE